MWSIIKQTQNKVGTFFRKNTLRASFTIEAGVVIPLSFVIIAASISLMIFIHDNISARAQATQAAIAQAEIVKQTDKKEAEDPVTEAAPFFLLADDGRVSIETAKDAVTARSGGVYSFPNALVRTIMGNESSRIEAEVSISHLDARKELLRYKALADGAEAVFGSGQ